MERTTCCVVGGGPAGMMLGVLLARAGVEVTVLEKHADFLRDFRGDTVHPSTMALLDEMGLGERFAALPQSRVERVGFPLVRADGTTEELTISDLSALSSWGVAHPYIAMVPQWDLLDLLADAGRAEPTFTLRMDTAVTGLLRDASGRVSGVAYRTTDGVTGELAADLVIGCDGRHSTARAAAELAGPGLIDHDVPFDIWWFRLPRHDGDTIRALEPRLAARRFAIVIPREGYFQIAYGAPKGRDAELRAAGLDAFRADVADLLPELADRVDTLASLDDVKQLDVRLDRLRRWYVDGLLCVGDAAHAMSPMGGVGINLAVQDAVAAARLLAGPLRTGIVGERELARVQRRRWLPTVAVQGLQRVMHAKLLRPALAGRMSRPPRAIRVLLRRVPRIAVLPAYLIGVGLRPEHAPASARREPAPARSVTPGASEG